ncbi:SAVED domain-containing protein [Micromonospora sp. WMMA1976]|uniref:SAVED domain-containing protein n=1 Tax=Micromonospora TaxID=1873 RepID=UPI00248AF0A2|nr:SAVED domain-containing protein [Micromonospora sp. WMMA1976]WBC05342.1 SAVED domain-containing protein [Micromonospora sp. WMMA1976]
MTSPEPEPAAGSLSRVGALRSGFYYQDLIAWSAALRVLQPNAGYNQLEIEVNGAGNVDDVILRASADRHRYAQVKWAAKTADLINDGYLTGVPKKGKSLLQKFHGSWTLLRDRDDVPPSLELTTNRALDPTDPLLSLVDGRSDCLNPAARLASPTSPEGRRIDEWASHLQCDRDDVLAMLDGLVFKVGLTISSEKDRAQALMLANGLQADNEALDRGVALIDKWVREGRRILTREDICKEVERVNLRADDPRAVLLVQAIKREPHPDDATVVLDWVDLYDGDTPPLRRQPRDPADWATMSNDIDEAVDTLTAQGNNDILLRGFMRQATFFTIGARLAQVTGTTITYLQNSAAWTSNAKHVPISAPDGVTTTVGNGNELAVAIGMSVDPTSAVSRYVSDANLAIDRILTLLPADGAHDQSVAGAGEAVAYAQALRNAIRQDLECKPAARVHIFLAGPGGLALLLGHRWNRVAQTTVYEDLGAGRGYVPAFKVDA